MTTAPPPDDAPGDVTLVECHHCHAPVPPGTFCGNCGAHLADDGPRTRTFAFAAAPHEHVGRAAIITTFFPHLGHRQAHHFRQALVVGVGLVVLLAAFRLYTPATVTAALLLPLLHVLYLYEVEVYEHEPLVVVAATFVCGGALGYLFIFIADRWVMATIDGTDQGIVVSGLLLPLIAQAFMLVGPLLLLSRRHFDESLDGLTFGVSSALGFTLVTVVAGSWHVLTGPLVGGVASDDILRIVRLGILAALVNAGTTGMITASLWLWRHDRSRGSHPALWRNLPASVAIALAVQLGLGLATYSIHELTAVVAVWAVAAAAQIVLLRLVIHFALLEEAADFVTGHRSACAECHRLVPTMTFCPACGAARLAAPKHARWSSSPGAGPETPSPARTAVAS